MEAVLVDLKNDMISKLTYDFKFANDAKKNTFSNSGLLSHFFDFRTSMNLFRIRLLDFASISRELNSSIVFRLSRIPSDLTSRSPPIDLHFSVSNQNQVITYFFSSSTSEYSSTSRFLAYS